MSTIVRNPADTGPSPNEMVALAAQIRRLAWERDALILAHSYQRPEIQDVAHVVGDSLRLSRVAEMTRARTIVFCGVLFMAETAKLLAPEKTVLIPDPEAGCSLAASITAEQLRTWKGAHPDAVVVAYVNTSAAVKAESDYCCTSANAPAVVAAIPADRQILFLPDLHLGLWLQRVTGRALTLWLGECHVHAGIRAADLQALRKAHPDAELLIHPECGCASSVLEAADASAYILSTEGMVHHAEHSSAFEFLVATEVGIIHRFERRVPAKSFTPVDPEASCQYMKLTTLAKLRDALLYGVHEVTVPTEIADRARIALERMVAIG